MRFPPSHYDALDISFQRPMGVAASLFECVLEVLGCSQLLSDYVASLLQEGGQ